MPVFILLVVFVGMPIMLSMGLDDRTAIAMAITMLAGGVAYRIWRAHQIIMESEKELQNLSRCPQERLLSIESGAPTKSDSRSIKSSNTPAQPNPQKNVSADNASISAPGATIQEDPVLTGCVGLTLGILESQKQFILARHNSMPPKAFDAFSLGYIAGTSLFISTRHEAGPDGYFLSLSIALNNLFGELGNELKDRLSAYIDVLDPEFLSGKQTAEREIAFLFRQKAENRNLVVPPMDWAMHVIKEKP